MKAKAWLSLGSNLGDKREHLKFAIARLRQNPRISVNKISSLYLTEPWGKNDQDDYYNAAVEITTDLTALELLDFTQLIEKESGRQRLVRWGPRELDIDIIIFDQLLLSSEELTVPHPRLAQRVFVLLPLREIAGDLHIPALGQLDQLIDTCDKSLRIERLYPSDEEGVWYENNH